MRRDCESNAINRANNCTICKPISPQIHQLLGKCDARDISINEEGLCRLAKDARELGSVASDQSKRFDFNAHKASSLGTLSHF